MRYVTHLLSMYKTRLVPLIWLMLGLTLFFYGYHYTLFQQQTALRASLLSLNGVENTFYNIERNVESYYQDENLDSIFVLQRQLLSLTTEADFHFVNYLKTQADEIDFSRRIIQVDQYEAYRESIGNAGLIHQSITTLNLLRSLVQYSPDEALRLLSNKLPLNAIITHLQIQEQVLISQEDALSKKAQMTLNLAFAILLLSLTIVSWHLYKSRQQARTLEANPLTDESKKSESNLSAYSSQSPLPLEPGKKQFLNLMSHEFRAPISAIIAALELLPNMKDKQSKLIQQAEQSCFRLLNLTNNLLDVLSDESSITPHTTRIDLISLLDECIALFSVQVRDKQVEFSMHCSHSVPHYIDGDPTLIANILRNILDNAVKFTSNGIIDTNITTKVKDKKVYLVVKVVDSGIGIGDGEQARIFERFYRGSQPYNQRYPGAGIGLSIVKKSLDALNGSLEVNSEQGLGSEFTLNIPISPINDDVPEQHVCGTARFAIVDDLEISRVHIQNLINAEGYRTRCFASGSDLLNLHDEVLQFSGVFVDLYMPGINGIELINTLTAIYGDRTPPIIVLSATPDIANIIANHNVEVWQSFVKPIDKNRIVDCLHHLANPRGKTLQSFSHARVLVIEDEAINAEMVENMMLCMGHIPTTVRSGEEAIIAAREGAFDAVLLDINLPDINGLEVARIIREQHPSIPIIALTANAHKSDKEQSLKAGIRYHLVKPVTFQELKNTLRLSFLYQSEH